jgi:hypothetical protein
MQNSDSYRVKKSDKFGARSASLPKLQSLTDHVITRKRSIIICTVKECPFYIHAAWSKRKECVVVSSILQSAKDTKGGGSAQNVSATSGWGLGDIADRIQHCSGLWKNRS